MKKWLILLILFLYGAAQHAMAQGCSVCTKTASELGEKGARGLNGGILYLAFLPLTILGGLAFYWYRYQRSTSEQ